MRQRDVLTLAYRGFSNREIARELGLAEPTVKGHVRSALRLLDAASRREAAERAQGLGWLDAG
jgi:DNA-binding NarL/FixJ family response regulator